MASEERARELLIGELHYLPGKDVEMAAPILAAFAAAEVKAATEVFRKHMFDGDFDRAMQELRGKE